MSLTDAELQRLTAIEEAINSLQIAVSNLATKLMVRQLELLRQRDLDSMETRIGELEAIISVLQRAL